MMESPKSWICYCKKVPSCPSIILKTLSPESFIETKEQEIRNIFYFVHDWAVRNTLLMFGRSMFVLPSGNWYSVWLCIKYMCFVSVQLYWRRWGRWKRSSRGALTSELNAWTSRSQTWGSIPPGCHNPLLCHSFIIRVYQRHWRAMKLWIHSV